jgi:precorrin-6B methylase 2
VQINMSKAKDLGGLNMLVANNPLFIIKGVKP